MSAARFAREDAACSPALVDDRIGDFDERVGHRVFERPVERRPGQREQIGDGSAVAEASERLGRRTLRRAAMSDFSASSSCGNAAASRQTAAE